MPELADFPGAANLEFSWGDQEFFQDPDAGVLAGLKAAFWSSGSVVHVVGFDQVVKRFYPGAEMLEVKLSAAAYDRLLGYLAQSFSRRQSTGRAPAKPGLFSYSRFYPATQSFSILRTCNTWVAEALAAAGLPLSAASIITAGQLAEQVAANTK